MVPEFWQLVTLSRGCATDFCKLLKSEREILSDCFVVLPICAQWYQSHTCLAVVADLASASKDLVSLPGVFISFLMPRDPNAPDLLLLRR